MDEVAKNFAVACMQMVCAGGSIAAVVFAVQFLADMVVICIFGYQDYE